MRFYEFFAGGGMARLGFGDRWSCLLANDFDPKKTAAYRANFDGAPELREADIQNLTAADLPGRADAAWASFPCQDLSLAGAGKGLSGARSGMFWAFHRLLSELGAQNRAPAVVVLENVYGLATARGGRDLAAICSTFAKDGWRFGALIVDAALFVPQSRPRLVFVAARDDVPIPPSLVLGEPDPAWHPKAFEAALEHLPPADRARWLWWRLPAPRLPAPTLSEAVQAFPSGVAWDPPEKTRALLALMDKTNIAKVKRALKGEGPRVGCVYRRTRPDGNGASRQRAEVRFDDRAGCLRTPGGGSSRQTLLIVDGGRVRSRLLSPREAARLMGLPESYVLPERYNDAYHLAGDGVAVPVVRWIVRSLVEPLVDAALAGTAGTALAA